MPARFLRACNVAAIRLCNCLLIRRTTSESRRIQFPISVSFAVTSLSVALCSAIAALLRSLLVVALRSRLAIPLMKTLMVFLFSQMFLLVSLSVFQVSFVSTRGPEAARALDFVDFDEHFVLLSMHGCSDVNTRLQKRKRAPWNSFQTHDCCVSGCGPVLIYWE